MWGRIKKRKFTVTLVLILFFYLVSIWLSEIELPGWEKHKSRNIHDYINISKTPMLVPRTICYEKRLLTVMVTTVPSNFLLRQSIRNTWGKTSSYTFVYFLIGRVDDSATRMKIDIEVSQFNDIIQGDFIDTYLNLTLKSAFLLTAYRSYCMKRSKFLLKVDDDVVVNMPLLLGTILQIKPRNILMGHSYNTPKPVRQIRDKWFIPHYLYAEETYPSYLCGAGYLMSNDIVNKLFRCVLHVNLVPFEDLYFTGICTRFYNIALRHHHAFGCLLPLDMRCNQTIKHQILIHHANPEAIYRIFALFQ